MQHEENGYAKISWPFSETNKEVGYTKIQEFISRARQAKIIAVNIVCPWRKTYSCTTLTTAIDRPSLNSLRLSRRSVVDIHFEGLDIHFYVTAIDIKISHTVQDVKENVSEAFQHWGTCVEQIDVWLNYY